MSYTYEHTIKGGADYSVTLQLTDSAKAPITLTGGAVASQIRRIPGDSLLGAFSCAISNVNQVTFTIPASLTGALPPTSDDAVWVHDALCTLPGGKIVELMEGTVVVLPARTHA